MNTVSKKLIKPTAAGIQEMARGYFSVDVRNGSVSMTEADWFYRQDTRNLHQRIMPIYYL